MLDSFDMEVIVTCNFCHDAPAAGWLKGTDPETGETIGRAACQLCADREGNENLLKEVVAHDES